MFHFFFGWLGYVERKGGRAGVKSWRRILEKRGEKRMETGNEKPLSMGAGVETSEIWSLKSVPEICGASWSGIETIMKADVSVWYHKFYHQRGLWKRESYLVHFNVNYLALCIALVRMQCS